MPIRFSCPHCKKGIQAPDPAVGKRIPCPHCQQPLVVPAAQAAPPAQPSTIPAPTIPAPNIPAPQLALGPAPDIQLPAGQLPRPQSQRLRPKRVPLSPATLTWMGAIGGGVVALLLVITGIYSLTSGPGQAKLVIKLPAERDNAVLEVDGQPVTIPAIGTVQLPLEAGAHRVRISRPGFLTMEETHQLAGGQNKVVETVWLTEKVAILKIDEPVAVTPPNEPTESPESMTPTTKPTPAGPTVATNPKPVASAGTPGGFTPPALVLDPRALTEQSVALGVLYPKALAESPLLSKLPVEDAWKATIGLTFPSRPQEIESVVLYLKDTITRRPDPIRPATLWFRLAQPLTATELRAKWPKADEVQVGGKPCLLNHNPNSTIFHIHQLDPQTVVLGEAEDLQALFAAGTGKPAIAERYAQMLPAAEIAILVDFDAMRGMLKDLPNFDNPAVPPPVMALKQVPALSKSFTVALSPTRPQLLQLTLQANDAEAGDQIETLATAALIEGQNRYQEQRETLGRMLGSNEKLLQVSDELIGGVTLQRDGNTVSAVLAQSKKLHASASQLAGLIPSERGAARQGVLSAPPGAGDWATYEYPTVGFQVDFPFPPFDLQKGGFGTQSVTLYQEHDQSPNRIRFNVELWDLTAAEQAGLAKQGPQYLWAKHQAAATSLKLGEHPGAEFTTKKTIDSSEGPYMQVLRTRMWLVGKRVFELTVETDEQTAPLIDAKRFFDSFKLRDVMTPPPAPTIWATTKGQRFEGTFAGFDQNQVSLKLVNGQTQSVPLADLIKKDAELVWDQLLAKGLPNATGLDASQAPKLTGKWGVDPNGTADANHHDREAQAAGMRYMHNDRMRFDFQPDQKLTIERTENRKRTTWKGTYKLLAADATHALIEFDDPEAKVQFRALVRIYRENAGDFRWTRDAVRVVIGTPYYDYNN